MSKIEQILEVLKKELSGFEKGEATVEIKSFDDGVVVETETKIDDSANADEVTSERLKKYDNNMFNKLEYAVSPVGIAYCALQHELRDILEEHPEHKEIINEMMREMAEVNGFDYTIQITPTKKPSARYTTNDLDEELEYLKKKLNSGEPSEDIEKITEHLNRLVEDDNKLLQVLNEVFEEKADERGEKYYLKVIER